MGFLDQCSDRGWDIKSSKEYIKILTDNIFKDKQKRLKVYLHNKVVDFNNRIDCYQDGWDEGIKYKVQDWIEPSEWNLGCNAQDTFIREYLLQLYVHNVMELCHKSLLSQVRGFNDLSRKRFYQNYKGDTGKVHPLITILHSCADLLKEVQYSNSSNPIAESRSYHICKVSIKDFSCLPDDISKVLNVSGYSKTLRTKMIINDDLRRLVLTLSERRSLELARDSHLE